VALMGGTGMKKWDYNTSKTTRGDKPAVYHPNKKRKGYGPLTKGGDRCQNGLNIFRREKVQEPFRRAEGQLKIHILRRVLRGAEACAESNVKDVILPSLKK